MLDGYEVRVVISICLVILVKCTLSNTAETTSVRNHEEKKEDIEILVSVSSDHSRLQRREVNSEKGRSIPPWLGNLYGRLKYTSYSIDKNDAKRGKIHHHKSNIVAEKRTIKIGNQVCGTMKDGKHGDLRWDDKRHIDYDDETKANNDDEEVIREVHNCCFDHAKCPRSVPAKTTKFGFTNDIEYTIMSCKCDSSFRRCLKDMKSYTADAIGHLYFDALKIPCLTFYDEAPESPRRSYDMISVVPDVTSIHPKIGGAQVILKPNEGNDQKDYFYTHEQEGVADSKEKGRKSSHPQLVRRIQYPTPKITAVTNKMQNKSNNNMH